jgi:hypothetical protein
MVRSPIQVDDDFRVRIKRIQEEIMKKEGKFESIPKITKRMVKMPEFDIIERKMLGEVVQMDFDLKLDGRLG